MLVKPAFPKGPWDPRMGLPRGQGDREITGEGYEGRLVTSSRKRPGEGWSGLVLLKGLVPSSSTWPPGQRAWGGESGPAPGLGPSEGVRCGREPRRAHICPAGREWAVAPDTGLPGPRGGQAVLQPGSQ